MRLFVAAEVDQSVLDEAQRAIEALRTALDGMLRPRWVAPRNLHLTIRFIGHVPADRITSVVDALAPEIQLEPFDVALDQCGVFPPHGPPRVLWIGLAEGLPSLEQMHHECNRRLLPLGYEPERRPFSAHLTLARIKDAPRGSGARVRDALSRVRVAGVRSRVSEAVLFESHLSPNGATYNPLLRIPLRPKP
jgi:2'-5' RNA ligase